VLTVKPPGLVLLKERVSDGALFHIDSS
jgi:hypothetical protein